MKMSKEEALALLQEAVSRIDREPPNGKGGGACGGAYWRLSQVLEYYLRPQLEEQEGDEHAAFIIRTHGEIVRRVPETY